MFTNLFRKGFRAFKPISTKCTLLLPVESASNGVLSRMSEFRVVDVSSSDNQFSSSDFSIGNLEAIGAYDILKRSIVVSTSKLNAADSFDNFQIQLPNVQES